jgi:hypothetical protein
MLKHARTAIAGLTAVATLAGSMVVMAPMAAAAPAGYYGGDAYTQNVRWYPRDRHRYYYGHNRYYHRHNDGGAALAAGLFGFITGAFVGSALNQPAYGGDPYCAQRFRSYNPATGTYTGYDGLQHPCP